MKSGDIAVMDRAYVDYQQLNTLTEQGVFWVTRSKSNMKVKVIKPLNKGKQNAPVDGKPPHYPIILLLRQLKNIALAKRKIGIWRAAGERNSEPRLLAGR